MSSRDRSPVFVVGSARSGTTLLYHTLLSSGSFAIYRGEPAAFDLLRPKFGDFRRRRNREKMINVWLRSSMCHIAGVDKKAVYKRVLDACDGAGDFLRIVMGEVARRQGKPRFAVWGPDNLLYMRQIKREMPDALFIHMIRDGRDVAVSMAKEGWIRPLPWDRADGLIVAALHWKWKVASGREQGQALGRDYLEVHFEDLVTQRDCTLRKIGNFIGSDLSLDQIAQESIGTIAKPNTSFQEERREVFRPIGRWERVLPSKEAEKLESILGPLLRQLGYKTVFDSCAFQSFKNRMMQYIYPCYFDTKQWLKVNTPAGSLTSIDRMNLPQ